MKTHNRLVPTFPWPRVTTTTEEPQVPAYRVGELFQDGRVRWPECVHYGYGPYGHELTLFVADPTHEEIDDVRQGDAQFALTNLGPVFYFAFRFGDSAAWRDVPYAWHVQHPESRATPSEAGAPEERALLWISLVGADDGVIRAQRGVTLSPSFTRTLHWAILDQVNTPFDPLECTLAIAETCRLRPNASLRLVRASAWSRGNS
ncbi:hypothetical protein [Paludisphaera rhizosphaerae]|uniref:hypothetical protein n=1 Tax=Paludisphaera rhizosphaerae TaxID=2711216 RepID=UPI0013ED7BA8|nr:hypothetical protein [Paludisphaera rhizosphaerae]